MKFVIARYNEDIEWTKRYDNVAVFNKGLPLVGIASEPLPNVGREGHTYYKYICDNYDNLDDYTVFLQGNPFDHSPNLFKNIQAYLDNPKSLSDFEWLSETLVNTSLEREEQVMIRFSVNYNKRINPATIFDTYERVFGERVTDKYILYCTGAQFIVSKEGIHKRPKEFYENILRMLDKDIDPIEVYHLERLHAYIFR
jgi:hypothetical protein